MKPAVVAVVALLLGCNSKPDCGGHYHFHSSFPSEWRMSAQLGVAKWNAFGIDPVSLDAGDESEESCSFKIVALDSPEYDRLKPKDGSAWAGVSNGHDSSIAFCPENWGRPNTIYRQNGGNDAITSITMHELGHVHGLVHIPDERAIMNPDNQNPDMEYTAGDLLDCELAGACR